MVDKLILLIIKDDELELQADNFQKRKASIDFVVSGGSTGPAVLGFNVSVTNAISPHVNISVKINGVEMQRYSFPNQPTNSIHEAFTGPVNLNEPTNIIEFEIVDTPTTDTAVVKISDVIKWITQPDSGAGGGTGGAIILAGKDMQSSHK